MIENIDSHQVAKILGKTLLPQSDVPTPAADGNPDATVQVDFDTLISQAKAADPVDAAALEEARDLLASGQLVNEQTLRATAESILNQGI